MEWMMESREWAARIFCTVSLSIRCRIVIIQRETHHRLCTTLRLERLLCHTKLVLVPNLRVPVTLDTSKGPTTNSYPPTPNRPNPPSRRRACQPPRRLSCSTPPRSPRGTRPSSGRSLAGYFATGGSRSAMRTGARRLFGVYLPFPVCFVFARRVRCEIRS